MKNWIVGCAVVGCLFSLSALANERYIDTAGVKCQVWIEEIYSANFQLEFQGQCRDGKAEGAGELKFVPRREHQELHAPWQGLFSNGVFVGPIRTLAPVQPWVRDNYWVPVAKLAGGLVARNYDGNEPPGEKPCHFSKITLYGTALHLDYSNDEKVKATAKNAYQAAIAGCPPPNNAEVEIRNTDTPQSPFEGSSATLSARARFENGALTSLQNNVREKAKEEKRVADAKKWMADFARKNKVAAWLRPEHLAKNRFLWEGKTVAMFVKLEEMVSPTSGVIGSVHGWGTVLLSGINPEFFSKATHVAIAAKVLPGLKTLKDQGDLVELQLQDSAPCEERGCGDRIPSYQVNAQLAEGEPIKP